VKHDRPGSADELRADLRVGVRWTGGLLFEAGAAGRARLLVDGDSKAGQSPPELLLSALATCTAVDVVLILAKRRTPVETLELEVLAERKAESPRRLVKAHLGYRITGKDIDRVHAERAIEKAVVKYCTVRDTMDPEMPITWSLDLSATQFPDSMPEFGEQDSR
jgi:putative redox protein